MTFEPFKFRRVPPLTVPTPPTSENPAVQQQAAAQPPARPVALDLADRFNALKETSDYLQSVVLAKTSSTGVILDFSKDPELGMAMGRIYGNLSNPPSVITVAVYNQLLDAQIGVMQLDMGLGKDSSAEANVFQNADLIKVTSAIENELIEDMSYTAQLPLLLRGLKNDNVIFSNWVKSLEAFPASKEYLSGGYTYVQPPGTYISRKAADLSQPVTDAFISFANQFDKLYGSVYSVMTGITMFEAKATDILNTYLYTPVNELIQIVALLNSLKVFKTKEGMQGLSDTLVQFVYARLIAETSNLLCLADRFVQQALFPLQKSVSGLGQILSKARRAVTTVAAVINGGIKKRLSEKTKNEGPLAGMGWDLPCASNMPHNKNSAPKPPVSTPTTNVTAKPSDPTAFLDPAQKVLDDAGKWITFAERTVSNKHSEILDRVQRMVQRHTRSRGDQTEILCAIRSIDQLVVLANGVVSSLRGASNSQQQQRSVPQLAADALAKVSTPTGATYQVSGNSVSILQPEIPVAPDTVVGVLARAGVTVNSNSKVKVATL